MSTLLTDPAEIATYEREANMSRALDAISAQIRCLHELSLPSFYVELWVDGEGVAQLRTHVHHGADFDSAKAQLIRMRDRLTREIADGPSKCPFARSTT